MPIPKPNNEETNEQFVERCMADETMQEYDEKQRLAICETQIEKKDIKMDIKKRHIIEIIEDDKTVTIVYEKGKPKKKMRELQWMRNILRRKK